MISVVIPLYNKEESILKTINSVLNQTYTDFEIVIIDDGSTDNSSTKVKEITDPRMSYYYQSNKGVSTARNNGVLKAKGEWIVFLDADDIIYSDCLEHLKFLIDSYGTLIAVANFYISTNGNKRVYSRSTYSGIIANNFKSYIDKELFIRTGNTIYSREVLLQNPFNSKFKRFEDLEMANSLYRQYKIAISPKSVFEYVLDYSELNKPRKRMEEDYICNFSYQAHNFWERVFYGYCLAQALNDYPDYSKIFLKRFKGLFVYMILFKVYRKIYAQNCR